MREIDRIYKNFISSIIFLSLSVGLYISSFGIQFSSAEILGPAFFPKTVGVLMGILSILLMLRSVTEIRKQNEKGVKEKLSKIKGRNNIQMNIPFVLNSVLIIIYGLLLNKIGFIITSIIYLICQIALITMKKDMTRKYIILQIIVSFVVPIALYYGFSKWLGVYLPTGIL